MIFFISEIYTFEFKIIFILSFILTFYFANTYTLVKKIYEKIKDQFCVSEVNINLEIKLNHFRLNITVFINP